MISFLLLAPHLLIFIVPLQGWRLMLFYGITLFFALKAATLLSAKGYNSLSSALYLTTWVGMEPGEFRSRGDFQTTWLRGTLSLGTGLSLIIFLPLINNETTQAVLFFTSLIFVFHFGLLELNAQLWQYFGRNTKPIMAAPWQAVTLAEFWGKRWNMAFRDAAHRLIFTPVCRKLGTSGAALAVFAFSGIVHEAVISIPAQGGYGGPMIYFLLQFTGICLQKRYKNFSSTFITRIFLLTPLPLLFHQPFFKNVFIPLTRIIGDLL